MAQVIREEPNVYELVDHKGEQIIGNFYEKLSAVDKKDDDVYRVEKILMRKKLKGKKMVLVKRLEYDAKHNCWIP